MNVREHVTEVTVSAGKKVQLEKFEPIDERATVTAEVPDGLSDDEFTEFVEELRALAWDEAETGVATRYEAHVRAEAFGDD